MDTRLYQRGQSKNPWVPRIWAQNESLLLTALIVFEILKLISIIIRKRFLQNLIQNKPQRAQKVPLNKKAESPRDLFCHLMTAQEFLKAALKK